jgi:hypothetical protein
LAVPCVFWKTWDEFEIFKRIIVKISASSTILYIQIFQNRFSHREISFKWNIPVFFLKEWFLCDGFFTFTLIVHAIFRNSDFCEVVFIVWGTVHISLFYFDFISHFEMTRFVWWWRDRSTEHSILRVYVAVATTSLCNAYNYYKRSHNKENFVWSNARASAFFDIWW